MNVPAPAGSVCPTHLDSPATWTCPRCGRFMCQACERRTRPESMPMCPACWDLRSQRVEPQSLASQTRLQTLGFWFGICSIIPFWPLVLASLVLNIIAIVKAKEPPARDLRWKPVVGLCVTLFSIVGWISVIAFAVTRH